MKTRGYFYCGLTTTLNIILYALTFENFLWLEGRVCHGYFRNWLRRFGYRPRNFEMPETEEKIVNLIKNSSGIRTFGAGHSFNSGLVAEDTLVSSTWPTDTIPNASLRTSLRGGCFGVIKGLKGVTNR
jgi:L-gulono-1,4-lactone dehydrogenase